MTISIRVVLLLIAIVCFAVDAVFKPTPVDLKAVGLAFFAAGELFNGVATAS